MVGSAAVSRRMYSSHRFSRHQTAMKCWFYWVLAGGGAGFSSTGMAVRRRGRLSSAHQPLADRTSNMVLEQRIRSEHRETEDRRSDHEQIEDIEDLVDDLGDAVQVGHIPR